MFSTLGVEQAIRQCRECWLGESSLNLDGGGPFSGWWKRRGNGALVFVVGMNPNKNRRPRNLTVGWNWERWAETLEQVVHPNVALYFTNLLKCSTMDNQLTQYWPEVNECSRWLEVELSEANSGRKTRPVVLVLGKQPGQWFDLSQYVRRDAFLGATEVTYYQLPHPAYAVRFGTYLWDLERARLHLHAHCSDTFRAVQQYPVERRGWK